MAPICAMVSTARAAGCLCSHASSPAPATVTFPDLIPTAPELEGRAGGFSTCSAAASHLASRTRYVEQFSAVGGAAAFRCLCGRDRADRLRSSAFRYPLPVHITRSGGCPAIGKPGEKGAMDWVRPGRNAGDGGGI